MQRYILARISAAIIALLMTTGLAFAAQNNSGDPLGAFAEDDGTYSIQIVTSVDACTALCEADKKTCRGSVVYQNDISKPEMECRLNNGIGANTAFQQEEPEALNFEKAISDLNAYRISKGQSALVYNEKLNRASDVHVRDLASADIVSHTGTDGSGHGDRVQLQGYYFSIAGENVAAGQLSWDAAFTSWKNSPGHNANMLRDDVSEFGLAFAYNPDTIHRTFWAMIVAHPLDMGYETTSE